MQKVIGTTEDRLNRFMSMCLEWQRDLRNGIYHPAAYYFTNYHLGKVKKEMLGDLKHVVVDRDWAIDKMNEISLFRAENEIGNGFNANNRTIYNKTNRKASATRQLDLFGNTTTVKTKTKQKKTTATKLSPDTKAFELMNELLSLGYKVTLEKKV
jgi:hypothetical protein